MLYALKDSEKLLRSYEVKLWRRENLISGMIIP